MCQAYEAEARLVANMERQERLCKLRAHISGEKPLTHEELVKIEVEQIMARDAGF